MEIPTTLATSIAKLINPSVIIQFTGDMESVGISSKGGELLMPMNSNIHGVYLKFADDSVEGDLLWS